MLKVLTGEYSFDVEWESVSEGKGKLNGQPFQVSMIKTGDQSFHIIQNNKSFRAEVIKFDKHQKTYVIQVNGEKINLKVNDRFDLLLAQMGITDSSKRKINELRSPMPGLVLSIQVNPGDEVKAGDPLLILEAMKMENVLKSPADLTIKKINVEKGIAVEKNELLIQFE